MRNALCVLVVSFLLVGCSEDRTFVPLTNTDSETLARMYQEIYDLVQDRSCGDSTERAAIALGSKPCGGPWQYLVYSKSTVDEAVLQALAENLADYEAQFNQEHRRFSDCEVVQNADPTCTDGGCIDRNQSP